MKICVIGAGSWGTALAAVFARNGHPTSLWARRKNLADEIREQRTNRTYLGEIELPDGILATHELASAIADAEVVVFAVPSSAMVEVVRESRHYIGETTLLAHAVKGFDVTTKRRMSEVLKTELSKYPECIAVISGPSHAEEVIRSMPTTLVVASSSRKTAETVQDLLMNPMLRVYTNPDVIGAELGGSLKNIIAIGVGIADGLGFGDNAKAALMTRGLAEIARLGVKMGASALTFAGLSGVGDLIVTCTSRHSRNYRTGRLLGQGHNMEEAVAKIGMAVEGIPATRATVELATQFDVEMPIATALYDILFERKSPATALDDLMGRARGHELEEVARAHTAVKWLHD